MAIMTSGQPKCRIFQVAARQLVRQLGACGALVVLASPALANAAGADLSQQIVVTARHGASRVLPDETVIDSAGIAERQPLVVADILRGITSIALRQNSRGETVVRIRSGDERQTPVFLDGVPLATPWDGRIDLGILPAGIVSEVGVTRSAAPIEYGANAISGVLDLRTTAGDLRHGARLSAQVGSGQLLDLAGFGTFQIGGADQIMLAATHRDSAFVTASGHKAIPFELPRNGRRNNTDQRNDSLFLALGHTGQSFALRASLLHADAERGIPAEGHLDPTVDQPRYWRYPLWRLTQATLNGEADLGSGIDLHGVAWRQWFAQDIDSFTDAGYTRVQEREGGRDRTVGGRLVISGPLGNAQWRLSGSAQSSTHLSITSTPATANGLRVTDRQRYRQQFLSAGAEIDLRLAKQVLLTLGAGFDASFTPLTGDKPSQPSQSAPGLTALLAWQVGDALQLKASLAQRTRFATLREQFGQALKRFLPNPDLKPERARTADLSIAWQAGKPVSGSLSAWLSDGRDTLDQRVVLVAGKRLRQRYNMRGAFTYGLEVTVNSQIGNKLTAELSSSLQGGDPRREPSNAQLRLVQQVKNHLGAALDWRPTEHLDLRAELQHYGRAWDLSPSGTYKRLPTASILNLRGFWTIARRDKGDSRVIASLSVDNVTDALLLPQLGLPAPGRTVLVGLRWEFGA